MTSKMKISRFYKNTTYGQFNDISLKTESFVKKNCESLICKSCCSYINKKGQEKVNPGLTFTHINWSTAIV